MPNNTPAGDQNGQGTNAPPIDKHLLDILTTFKTMGSCPEDVELRQCTLRPTELISAIRGLVHGLAKDNPDIRTIGQTITNKMNDECPVEHYLFYDPPLQWNVAVFQGASVLLMNALRHCCMRTGENTIYVWA